MSASSTSGDLAEAGADLIFGDAGMAYSSAALATTDCSLSSAPDLAFFSRSACRDTLKIFAAPGEVVTPFLTVRSRPC
jgi:hypothetical protein